MYSVLLGLLLSLYDLIHLLGQFIDLGFELDILFNHLFPVGSILVYFLAWRAFGIGGMWLRYEIFFIVLKFLRELLLRGFGLAGLHLDVDS